MLISEWIPATALVVACALSICSWSCIAVCSTLAPFWPPRSSGNWSRGVSKKRLRVTAQSFMICGNKLIGRVPPGVGALPSAVGGSHNCFKADATLRLVLAQSIVLVPLASQSSKSLIW
eukprot:6467555-Amphidinium_carterae.7